MAEKQVRKLSPVGAAKWAHVHKPKAPHKDRAGGKYMFQIDVCFEKGDPAWKEFFESTMAQIKAMPQQMSKPKSVGEVPQPIKKQVPIKVETDKQDQPTGRYYVTFKTGVEYPPGVFDKYGRTIPPTVMIGNESKVQISYIAKPYDDLGGGIAFYLNAVQVKDLVEYGGHSATGHGFEVEALPPDAPEYPAAQGHGFSTEPPPAGGYPEEPPPLSGWDDAPGRPNRW